jgi:antitoxin CcdA
MLAIMHMFSSMEMRMGKALEVRARKSTNVTLPPEVLDRAKELGINLSRASERGVREEIQETEARRWADDNAELVAAYTAMVERDGLPLAKYRSF